MMLEAGTLERTRSDAMLLAMAPPTPTPPHTHLDLALAKGRGVTEHQGAIIVVQRPRQDLRGAGASFIHKDHQRRVGGGSGRRMVPLQRHAMQLGAAAVAVLRRGRGGEREATREEESEVERGVSVWMRQKS